ncbi:dynamin family protein [Ruegeria sp. Ofav3-42]|uniref:dynamin family protein n=1 Tax=Ruegeria sp. Ofav3-42 TaxID=2917759 RepID=UPI001EF53C21|nr:dynamin family protein [Ruegeria sp. Ofav3-42]MCG7520040.1 dynamin family protein [Ruegeria sp. Ofav3-42]
MAKDSQTRFVSPKAWERIEQWSRRKPVFALMGEFSAGKSTLMNFLLRSHTLPTQVTATQLPPVWFSWGKQSAYVQRHDGTREDIELDQLESVGVNDAQFVRIFLESDILEAVDLIDTPGISDPKISTDVWRRAVGQANGVLWCTHATQAWRETERATWVALPERLQHNSLLLITRADTLGPKDRQKVLRRVNREAGHLFNRSILFSARDAITARDKSGDAELWGRSGGGKMVDSFLEITEQIMDNRADMLARYQIDNSLAEAPRVQPIRPAKRAGGTDQAAPLKLVNPVQNETEKDEVVTSFPVRPARVEIRAEDTERAPRINADEAERLRAEMAAIPDDATPSVDAEEDELRSFFRETPSQPLNLSDITDVPATENAFLELDDEELEEDEPIDLEAEADDEHSEVGPDDQDNFMASLGDKLADTPEQAEANEPASDSQSSDVSVSSITALLAEQSGASDDEFEPEPETSGLIETQVVPMSNGAVQEAETETLEDLLNVEAGSSLSASAMWREITVGEDLPEDPEGLKKVFNAFLEEFDKIAAEHSARRAKEDVPSIPKTGNKSGAEWHVL